MLEKRDFEMIRGIMKEEVEAVENRLGTKVEKEIAQSEARVGSLIAEKIIESEARVGCVIEEKITESQNLLLEEMDRLYQKSKDNLCNEIGKLDAVWMSNRIAKVEQGHIELRNRVEVLEQREA